MQTTGVNKQYSLNALGRREFLGLCGRGICGLSALCLAGMLPAAARAQAPRLGLVGATESPWYSSLPGGDLRCELCPRQCLVPAGRRGRCGVRENRSGRLYSLVYGNPAAIHLDPVEKNPLFHVLPSTMSLCLATAGCNMHCRFCQVWELSQFSPEEVYSFELSPAEAIVQANNMQARSVAFTFVEPVVFLEYALAVGTLARRSGLLSLVHTNGYIQEEPLGELCRETDAFNVDLKGFSEEFYRDLCAGELKPVLETLRHIRRAGIHLELTTLVIPTRNDDPLMIHDMAQWVREELGEATPLHFTRFYPLYKLRNLPPTPVAAMEEARETALAAGLRFVYLGNVPGHEGENTFCPDCGMEVIKRSGFMVVDNNVIGGDCRWCGAAIPGIWDNRKGDGV